MNKKDLTVLSTVICRTPAFSFNKKFQNIWPRLKEIIKDSSPEFYALIKDVNAVEVDSLPVKMNFSIWKYANRAQYRATPFGKFASLTMVPIEPSQISEEFIQISEDMNLHRFVSWTNKIDLDLLPVTYIEKASSYQTNASYYIVGDEIRFLFNNEGTFNLTAIEHHESIVRILNYCLLKRSKEELYQCVFDALQLNENEVDELIENMIDSQLLLTDVHPNIIGSDYFERVNFQVKEESKQYIIAERKLLSGGISSKRLENLKELIHVLDGILPIVENDNLSNFKQRFFKRYEHRFEIPLLEALDPEIGIGYTDLINESGSHSLVDEIGNSGKGDYSHPKITYSALHRFLLNNIASKEPIQLEDFKVSDNKESGLPNSFSALVQFTEENVIVKQIGGCTATSLIGRFTIASNALESFGREITNLEEEANPEVLFFDIAYQAESHVDDVNRRRALHSFELPILTWSESNNILELNDLKVSIIGGEIVLRSRKYNKRVIPRLASAYNYSRSDLSVFRFLSDLQHQGLHANLTVSPDVMFPRLNHYPRVQYKDIILSPEKWLVPEAFCKKTNFETEKLGELKKWLNGKGISGTFLSGFSDQKLCFDPSKDEDLSSFLLFCRNRKDLYIEEAFLPQNSLVKDERGNPYLAEFILSFSHDRTLYKPVSFPSVNTSSLKKRDSRKQFIPGSEWLYLKIYCHPNRSNELLSTNISDGMVKNRMRIKKWFFIRYQDPEHHLRLRIHLKSPLDLSFVLAGFQDDFEVHIQNGTVQDLQLAVYNRELDRYGNGGIEEMESVFALDSKVILILLEENLAVEDLYAVSIDLLIDTMEKLNFALKDQLSFVKKMAQSFSNEHNVDGAGFKKINTRFRGFYKTYSNLSLKKSLRSSLSNLSDKYKTELENSDSEMRETLLADVFHMHVNRLFAQKQRVHELIIYEFAFICLKKKARY